MISKELSTEDLDELEKQRRQLEEEVEAEQHPTAPSMTKQLTVKILQCFYGMLNDMMDYLEEVDPDVERAESSRHKVMADLVHYEQLLYEKRREATQATLDVFFSRVSLSEAFAAMSLIPAKSLLPVTSLSPACQQAALPSIMFRRHHRQMLTTQASSNSPPLPPTPHPSSSASKDFRSLLVRVTVLFLYFKMSISFIFIFVF